METERTHLVFGGKKAQLCSGSHGIDMAKQHPYMSPKLPFTGCIQGCLFEGKTITVAGRVLAGAEMFCVNLQCVNNTTSDIALHFNPRYFGKSGYVVCNTMQNFCWGLEQRSKHTPLPRGSDFILTFLITQDSYSIIINGVHFMEYLHRLPVSNVNAIFVDGGVEIASITFQNPVEKNDPSRQNLERQRYRSKLIRGSAWNMRGHQQHEIPEPAPPPYSASPSYVIPYKTIIQGGLSPGRSVTIQGCVNHNADRFCINLRYISGIAFHFNPRFNDNVVVRNSLIKDRWGREERSGGLPFYRGQQFMVTITCDTQCYRISVNGTQMFTYNHRHFLLQQIDILEVDGNISVSSVTV